jgi:hypothetical protein
MGVACAKRKFRLACETRLTLLGGSWWVCTYALREGLIRPLRTLSNMLAALREEDSSIHAQSARTDDVLGEVFQEASSLSRTLREQQLRLVNRAGEQLLGDGGAAPGRHGGTVTLESRTPGPGC